MFRSLISGPCWDRTNDPPDMHRDALTAELRIRKTQRTKITVDPVGIEPTTP